MKLRCNTTERVVWTIGNEVRPGPDPGEVCECISEDEEGYIILGYGKKGFPKGSFDVIEDNQKTEENEQRDSK